MYAFPPCSSLVKVLLSLGLGFQSFTMGITTEPLEVINKIQTNAEQVLHQPEVSSIPPAWIWPCLPCLIRELPDGIGRVLKKRSRTGVCLTVSFSCLKSSWTKSKL